MFKNDNKFDFATNEIHTYNGVLSGTESDSGVLKCDGYKTMNFNLNRTLSSDYIQVLVKLTEDDQFKPVALDGDTDDNYEVRVSDLYRVDLTGLVALKIVRVGLTEGDININCSLTCK